MIRSPRRRCTRSMTSPSPIPSRSPMAAYGRSTTGNSFWIRSHRRLSAASIAIEGYARGMRAAPVSIPASVRAVAMDLDRTILADNLEFSPATVRAVGRVNDAGIAAIVATGRMFASARPYALELGVTAPVICYQGALVADPRTGEWLLH